jgi:peptide deformylase
MGGSKGFRNVYGCFHLQKTVFLSKRRKKATIKSLNVHGNPFTLTAGALQMLFACLQMNVILP